jgi:glucose uptake protein
MMLPTTYVMAMALTILTMICWGSWANTMKLAPKWRFELYYFDYTFGLILAAIVAAFTFGSSDTVVVDSATPSFTFVDNLSIASKRQMAMAMAGGAVFNLANLLLVAAIAVAGLAVAFPIGIGLALIMGVVLNYIIKPAGNPAFLFGGSFLVLIAIVLSALAHAAHTAASSRTKQAGAQGGVRIVGKPQAKAASPLKGIFLSLGCGILMGTFYPLVEMSKRGDIGLGPYTAAFMFAVGVLVTTPVYNLFFMNLPVQGDPVSFRDYFSGTTKMHLLGLAGGIIWMTGTVANFVAASAPERVNVGPAVSYAIGQGATLVSALWGLLVWKEFAGAEGKVRIYIMLMLAFFVGGLALVSIAPLR